ncbi:MAG TPA: hypothetical protein ENK61_05040 [Devosia sp.]|nr:hypothetical protein [Devosia sp.]
MKKRFEIVDAEILAGRLWRAKEILCGMMAGKSYDVELFEKMGMLLLLMGDDLEAGKYLFLSGVRKKETRAAVELFLSKANKRDFIDFWSCMPARAKYGTGAKLPLPVIQELNELGFEKAAIMKVFAEFERHRIQRKEIAKAEHMEPDLKERIIIRLIIGLAVILIIGFLYQALVGLGALWAILAG